MTEEHFEQRPEESERGRAYDKEQEHPQQTEHGSRPWGKSMSGTFEEEQRASENLYSE